MLELDYIDRSTPVKLLEERGELASERQRSQVLEIAGLGELVPRMDLSDPQYSAVSEIVSYLSDHRRLTYEQETFG